MKQAKKINGLKERIIQKESTKMLEKNEVIKTIRKGYWSHKKNGKLSYREGMYTTVVENLIPDTFNLTLQ